MPPRKLPRPPALRSRISTAVRRVFPAVGWVRGLKLEGKELTDKYVEEFCRLNKYVK